MDRTNHTSLLFFKFSEYEIKTIGCFASNIIFVTLHGKICASVYKNLLEEKNRVED